MLLISILMTSSFLKRKEDEEEEWVCTPARTVGVGRKLIRVPIMQSNQEKLN